MADLAKGNVTIHESWFTDGLGGSKHVARRVTMALSSHGNGTSGYTIPASALTLEEIAYCSPFVKEGDASITLVSPNVEGTLLLTGNASGNVTALTGNYTGVVVGPTEI